MAEDSGAQLSVRRWPIILIMLGQQGFGDEHILGFEGAFGHDPLAFFEEIWQDALVMDLHFLMVIRDGKDHMGFWDMVADGSLQGSAFY